MSTIPSPVRAADLARCCAPVAGGVLDAGQAERLARMFRALADPTRVRLVSLIAGTEAGEACLCDLTEPVGLSQPTVSHHMKQLVEAGLVTREQRGRWAYYAIEPAMLEALSNSLRPRPTGTSTAGAGAT